LRILRYFLELEPVPNVRIPDKSQDEKPMNRRKQVIAGAAVVLAAAFSSSLLMSREKPAAAAQKASAPAQAPSQSNVERGRYLVEDVAMCEECHTPRDAGGNLDESRRLQGAQIWIVPVHKDTNWANNAPPLAGFAGYTDEQGVDILEKGVGPNGETIRRPMHIYHMNHADAQAIIAYLRSLPAAFPQ
jgi:mono/diheme cytochrome c family protein